MRAMVHQKLNSPEGSYRTSRKASVTQLAHRLESSTIEEEKEEEEGENEDSDSEPSYVASDESDPEDIISDDSGSEGTQVPLPVGSMDEYTKRKLQQAMLRTPRYLSRAWRNSDMPSGGYIILNTRDAITPLAYDKRRNCGKTNIFDHSRHSLSTMAVGHLQGSTRIATEFSSWGASLQIAFNLADHDPDAYISVIDTRKLSKRNVVLHVPSLSFLDGNMQYDWEYLAHGPIKGPALSVVPFKAFNDIGLLKHFGHHSLPGATACSSKNFPAITRAEVKQARKVADQYAPNFTVAVTLAILCLKQRCGDFWDCGNIKNLQVIADSLQDCNIPQHWCRDQSILTDIAYTHGYGELKQMIHLLHALVDYCHGKGARGRSRSRARAMSRPNIFVSVEKGERRGGKTGVRWPDEVSTDNDEEEYRSRKRTRHLEAFRFFYKHKSIS